jgi:Spy/CpxP family protein refolding chaperone
MKSRIIVVAALATLALPLVAFAEEAAKPAAPASTEHHSSAPAKSPEEMAKQALAKWKTTLKLTDEQSPQFETVMTDSYTKMAAAKTEAAGDKSKMKASMETILKDREEALAKVLTPEQMKTYKSQTSKNVKSAKKHMANSSSK